MSSISIVIYATSKTNIQFYSITFVPTSGPSISALARYSELRAFRKLVSVKKGFPPKLYFPTPEDLDKRRLQISKWLSSLLPVHEKELESFMRAQRLKYEEDEIEGVQNGEEVPLYVSNSDCVRRWDPVAKSWPSVITFHLFHVHLDMDSHLYTMGNLIWAPSFRGIQVYYPPWHKSLTLPYPDNFLKSVAPQHGVTLDYQFVLYHHKQVIALDIPTCAWVTFPPISPSVSTIRDNLWWPGFVAAGRHIHLIYPTEHFVFNTSTRFWKSLTPLPVTGTFYPGWVYAKKKIYMMVCSGGHASVESYCYDVRLDEWMQVAAFPAMHNVPTVVNTAFDGNNFIYVRTSSHIFCYDILDNSWEEKKEMSLSDRSMAMFFSTTLEDEKMKVNEVGGGEVKGGKENEVGSFRSKAERLFVRSKLAGTGPWGELAGKLQITQVERDLMCTFESASLAERLNIFRKMDATNNVFQQLIEEEPSVEGRERIEWHIFQALQEDPSLGPTLCNICPGTFEKMSNGNYTWAAPSRSGSPKFGQSSPKRGNRRKVEPYLQDTEVRGAGDDETEEGEKESEGERGEEELKEVKARGEAIMTQLKERNVQIPDEFICPITHTIMIEPVVTNDGNAFERAAIESWFSHGNDTSPVTREKLTSNSIFPNLSLRKMIHTFLESHGVDVG